MPGGDACYRAEGERGRSEGDGNDDGDGKYRGGHCDHSSCGRQQVLSAAARPGSGVSDAGPCEVELWVRDRGAQFLQQSSGGGDCRRGAVSCLSGRPDFALLRWGPQEYGARGLGGKDDGGEVAGGDTAWFRP